MKAIDFLESSIKKTRGFEMSDCQVLILIALARSGRPLQVFELSEETGKIRQKIYKAIELMDNDLVTINRPCRVKTLVSIRQKGVDRLQDIMGIKGESSK